MTAEAIYPIIEQLDLKERTKLLKELQKDIKPVKKKKPIITDAQARAYLIKNYLKS